MKKAEAFLALVGFLVIGTASVRAQFTSSEVRTAIDRGNAAFIKAHKDGDAVALAAIFDEKGCATSAGRRSIAWACSDPSRRSQRLQGVRFHGGHY